MAALGLAEGTILYIGGDLALSLGGREKFRGPTFFNDLFWEKIFILTSKISDDLL